ncbi:MAG: hypothetical protein ACRETM_04265 [Stenotrophobium sp.]
MKIRLAHHFRPLRGPLSAVALCLLLQGCWINDDISAAGGIAPPGASSSTVSGVAATGAAIGGGTVALHCRHGFNTSTTSANDGVWTATVLSDDLPCAVQVSGGTVNGVASADTFYSFALAGSGTATTANITPISDLVMADAVDARLDAWFSGATDEQLQQVADGIDDTISAVSTALAAAGYTLPENFDPLTTAISAGDAADIYDLLLEAYKQALADAGTSYVDARSDYTAGGELPAVASGGGSDEVSGPLTAPVASDAASFLAGLEGNYKLKVVSASGTAASEFEVGGVYAVKFTVGTNDSHSVSVTGATRTTSHLYIQKSLTDYQAGTTETLSFFDNFNNTCCQYYITYTPDEGYLTIEAAIGEGLVKLESKKGTPPPTDSEPSADAGILGNYLKNVLAGDYTLKCSDSNGASTTFAFTIKPDGSSTLDGAPLLDAAHPGSIKIDGAGSASSSMTVRFSPSAARSAYAAIGFKPDGTFYPNSVHTAGPSNGTTGKTLICYSNTGHTAPPTSAQAYTALGGAIAALARSETLNCTQAGAAAARSFGINSDGSAQVGSESFAAGTLMTVTDNYLFGTGSGRVEFADTVISGGTATIRSLQVALKADRATAQVLVGTGLGPNDVSDCSP